MPDSRLNDDRLYGIKNLIIKPKYKISNWVNKEKCLRIIFNILNE